jgi:hypothetical protein
MEFEVDSEDPTTFVGYQWMEEEAFSHLGSGQEWLVLSQSVRNAENLKPFCDAHFGAGASDFEHLIEAVVTLEKQSNSLSLETTQTWKDRHPMNKAGQATVPTSLLWTSKLLDVLLWAQGAPLSDSRHVRTDPIPHFPSVSHLELLNITTELDRLDKLLSDAFSVVTSAAKSRSAVKTNKAPVVTTGVASSSSTPGPSAILPSEKATDTPEIQLMALRATGVSMHYSQIVDNLLSVVVALRRYLGVCGYFILVA